MRRPHIVQTNTHVEYPHQAIWFDTETYFENVRGSTQYHHLKFGYACSMRKRRGGEWGEEEWLRFTTRAEFWDWVVARARAKCKLYLFCHNTSYDVPVMDVVHELPPRGFILRTAIIDAPPTILKYRNGNRSITLLDTLNIWRMPLKILGEEIGLKKYPMPADNDLGIDWETYGRRDVEIIRDACLAWWQFLEDNDYGSFQPTLAGQAMTVYRHKYMSHKILIDDNEKATKLGRAGYHGARCECFFIGKAKGKYTLLDVNSMYPHVMAVHAYPHRLISYMKYVHPEELRNWANKYAVTARVTLRTNVPFACVRQGEKLIFPTGEFETILHTPEVLYAFQHAEIVDVKEVAVFACAHLFTTMMIDLYQRRLDARRCGDHVSAFLFRKLMNSFYGKWGQAGGRWDALDNIEDLSAKRWVEIDIDKHVITKYRQLGGLVQCQDHEGEARDSFPAIAGHVTAYARLYLWDLIGQAGIDNVYYCDTDSLLVNEEGRERLAYLTDPELMGRLSIKGEFDDMELWGAKDYRFGDQRKTKGVRKDAIWLDDHAVIQTLWSGLRGLVASGNVTRPITRKILKKLSRNYDKGIILPDGRVQPLTLFPDGVQ